MLVVVGAGGAQHVSPLLGEGPPDGRAGHGVGERQHAEAVEGPFGRSEVPHRGVADLLHADDRLGGQPCALLVGPPLRREAHDGDRQAPGTGGLLELEGVPGADRRGDPGGIGRHIQKAAPGGDQMRIDGRRHDPAAVHRAVRRHQEGIVEHERMGRVLTAEGRVPEGAGVDDVHGLAQIEVEVLRRPAPMAVQGHGCHGPRHQRDADARTHAMGRRHDRVLSHEGDGGSRLGPGEADVREEAVERRHRVEGGRLGCGRRRRARPVLCRQAAGPGAAVTVGRRAPPRRRTRSARENCRSNPVTARGPRSACATAPAAASVRAWMSLPSLTATTIRASSSTGSVGARPALSSDSVTRTASSARARCSCSTRSRATSGRRMACSENSTETRVHWRSTTRSGTELRRPGAPTSSPPADIARRSHSALGAPAAVEEREEHCVLVGEVGVEGALGEPGPGADVGDRGRSVALLGVQLHRGIEQGGDREQPAFRDSSGHTCSL